MSLLDRLERTRFGKFGIPNLMRYVIGVNIVGILISLVNPTFYYSYLSLDIASILHGQVWRIFTFVLSPSGQFGGTGMVSLLWFAIWIFVYYSIGTNLERMWGTFRFNLFLFWGTFTGCNHDFYFLSVFTAWVSAKCCNCLYGLYAFRQYYG